jgi:hypothetical protein
MFTEENKLRVAQGFSMGKNRLNYGDFAPHFIELKIPFSTFK